MENDRPTPEAQDSEGLDARDARHALSRRTLLAGGAGVAGLVAGAGLLGRNQAASAAPAAAGIQTNVASAASAFLQYKDPNVGAPLPVGESRDATFKNWTELSDYSFKGENPLSIGSATSGAGGGKMKFDQFAITKFVDNTSPQLFQAMATGIHYGEVTLAVRKPGGSLSTNGKAYLIFTFGTVVVVDMEWSDGEVPQEKVTFAFGKMNIEYHTQPPAGGLGPANSYGWDETINKQWKP